MKDTALIELCDVYARIAGKDVLQGVSLVMHPREVHVIMGPNGAGKSSIAKLIAGDPSVELISGDILFSGESIKNVLPEERVGKGIFMSFQNPMELPGVKLMTFLKAMLQAKRKAIGMPPLSEEEALAYVKDTIDRFSSSSFIDRDVNTGFSGGEKKRSEIIQMAIADPKVSILDEIDSGLDIDSLKAISKAVLSIHEGKDKTLLLITHYKRLLEYIRPDRVHVMVQGKIVKSGGFHLVDTLEKDGYESFTC